MKLHRPSSLLPHCLAGVFLLGMPISSRAAEIAKPVARPNVLFIAIDDLRPELECYTKWVNRKDHSKIDAVELYDEQSDPQENTNIAKLSSNKAIITQLDAQWQTGWKAVIPK